MREKVSHVTGTKRAHKNGYAARVERNRERVLQHATQRFLAHGFTSVRMEDLSEELGMGKSTIYRNFPSKDDLLDAVLERFMGRIQKRADSLINQSGSGQVQAARLAKGISKELQSVSVTFLEDLRKNRPERYGALSRYRQRVMGSRLEQIVRRGQEMGDFRTDIVPSVVSAMVWASVEEMTDSRFMAAYRMTYNSVIENVLSVVFCGLSKDPNK